MQRQLITPPVPRLLGMPHAAAFLGISPRTFEKLWRAEKLPQPCRLGRRLLWDVKVLERFVDEFAGIAASAATDDQW